MNKKLGFYPYEHYSKSFELKKDFDVDSLCNKVSTYFAKEIAYPFYDGKEALKFMLESLSLVREDEIMVSTTFDYPNVSSCVTSTIFNYCKPSRVLTPFTKAVLIIHEFGVYNEATQSLKKECESRNIPLIEDLAHSVLVKHKSGIKAGDLGDWVILSFSKLFPIINGGMLVGARFGNLPNTNKYEKILDQLGHVDDLWQEIEHIAKARMNIFQLYEKKLKVFQLKSIVKMSDIEFPWFFPLEVKKPERFMEWLRSQGVDAGLWHGSNVVVMPLHQYLNVEDIDYIVNRIELFVSNNGFD